MKPRSTLARARRSISKSMRPTHPGEASWSTVLVIAFGAFAALVVGARARSRRHALTRASLASSPSLDPSPPRPPHHELPFEMVMEERVGPL